MIWVFHFLREEGILSRRLHRLRKKCFLVIPSEARDLLFFAKTKKKQIPRANPALRNDSLRVFPQALQPVGFGTCKDQTPQAEARATQPQPEGIVEHH
jgi:hypothetical protein